MNILIIGLGSIAKKHISAIRLVKPQAQIFALRSSSSLKDSEVYQNVQNIYSLQELSVKPDFVLIANPTQKHCEAINQSLRFSCPLFIEKPVLDSLIHSETISRKINDTGVITYVACNLRFHPALVFFRKYLSESSPRINEVNIYSGSYLPNWRPGKNFREIYSVYPDMGGGVHLDLFHELDYTFWLFGKPNQVSSIKRNVSSLNIKAVDYANYLFEYKTYSVNIILNYYRKDSKRLIEVLFDDDTWTIDLIKNKITDSSNNIVFEEKNFEILETYYQQMTYFINAVKNKKQTMNSFANSIDILKLCLNDGNVK